MGGPSQKRKRFLQEKRIEEKRIANVFSTVFSGRETEEWEVPRGKGLESRRLKWHYFVTVVGIQTLFWEYIVLYLVLVLLVFVYSFAVITIFVF